MAIRCTECGAWKVTERGMYAHWMNKHRPEPWRMNGEIIHTVTDICFQKVKACIDDTNKNKYSVPDKITNETNAPVLHIK